MSKVSENGEEKAPEPSSSVACEVTEAKAGPVRSGPSWKQIAVAAGGFAVTVVGTVVVTLVATNNSARMANAAAYAHGLLDGAKAARNGCDFDEEDDYYDGYDGYDD
ncbi:hypothetical protein DWB77_04190 [Streptomyces hundungensis]|uniref:Transmembrane protein n=1 Tax=Streptomyces hundungensis TaxID=1077946 RepID=A0A387HMF1_9ACTN|nr:hypothetical protein [Streptomyces hundungensis]AYG82022.1 hypothetical protein DWB77_04190 [Streptomyces hundungensis]